MGILSSFVGIFNARLAGLLDPPKAAKEPGALRIGILGAAMIAPNAVISPALSHPGVVIQAVAARDENRARAYATRYGIPTVFKSYQEMLDSPEIDAIYNPLPNYYHFEWTMKALKAGKHVLLEKPSANNAEEIRQMVELAKEKNLVLLEAFHYRHHPANQRFKQMVTDGNLGALKKIEIRFNLPHRYFAKDDIRFKYDLGGGATTDLGCYAVSYCRWLAGSEPTVEFAKPVAIPSEPNVDRAMATNLVFDSLDRPKVLAELEYDLAKPWIFGLIPALPELGLKVICEKGEVTVSNFPAPHLFHSITVSETGKAKRTEQVFKPTGAGAVGEEWWTTYRYQMEAFVNQVRGKSPQLWISGTDSIAQMKVMDSIYEKSGLAARPASTYRP